MSLASKLLLLTAISISLLSCRNEADSVRKQCDSLTLIYMAANNNLSKAALDDFEEIRTASVGTHSVVLMLCDCDYTSDDGSSDWNEARLYEIEFTGESDPIVTELDSPKLGLSTEWSDDILDSGNIGTLGIFLSYAKDNYESTDMNLVLWNHGGGWKGGNKTEDARSICSDESESSSFSLQSLRETIIGSGIHFSTVVIDACSMAGVETCATFSGSTDTIVFSEDLVPEGGMPYERIIPLLCSTNITKELRAEEICRCYKESYIERDVTISAVKLDEDSAFKNFIGAFQSFLSSESTSEIMGSSKAGAKEFTSGVVDMSVFSGHDFLFDSALKEMVITSEPGQLAGVSIYCPSYPNYHQDYWEYNEACQPFIKQCPPYKHFLDSLSSENNTDTCEPNNHYWEAQEIHAGNNITSKLWCPDDIDWYEVPASEHVSGIEFTAPQHLPYGIIVEATDSEGNRIRINDDGFQCGAITIPENLQGNRLLIRVRSPFGEHSETDNYTLHLF